ncbi:hypothetical protein C6W84_17043 (plasmid) [Acinetobacter baumannii]|nr:hypothetical protein C6W84_17043 [Acinetobacter baumannii]
MKIKTTLLSLIIIFSISTAQSSPLPFVEPPQATSSQAFLYISGLLMALKVETNTNLAALKRYPTEGLKKQLLIQTKLCDLRNVIDESMDFMKANRRFYKETYDEMYNSLADEKETVTMQLKDDCEVMRKQLNHL